MVYEQCIDETMTVREPTSEKLNVVPQTCSHEHAFLLMFSS